MERKEFEEQLHINFEMLDVILGTRSALDSASFIGQVRNDQQVSNFLEGYGINLEKPVEKAELFGNFQEALQFIRKYFIKEAKKEGIDLKIPKEVTQIVDVTDLFVLSTKAIQDRSMIETSLWAGIVLKVMHTILHIDKDLRYSYFNTIQTQIFDRYYKYIHRDWMNRLCLRSQDKKESIPIKEFQTKSKKSRDSVIIKLLHKKENVAEELFDRVGIRFVTYSKYDALRVLMFLSNNYIIIPHNIKPSRSQNSLVDIEMFKKKYHTAYKEIRRSEKISSKDVLAKFEKITSECKVSSANKNVSKNLHSANEYRAIHFTCRQLIKYTNPFYKDFLKLKKQAQSEEKNPLSKRILKLDTSTISKNLRFFYPYEVQITDAKSHKKNTEGEASHGDYKKSQLKSAMRRLFDPLLKAKGISS